MAPPKPLYFLTHYTATKNSFTLLEITIGQEKIHGWSAQLKSFTATVPTYGILHTVARWQKVLPKRSNVAEEKTRWKAKLIGEI
jgi:hypothetical protein